MPKVRVAVIGAGAAGLCSARHLSERRDAFEFVVYEKTGKVGGTWVYVEQTGKDQHGQPIHSSMYQNLLTNLPKEVMAFPDFPFKDSLPSFLGHSDVRRYLEDYADHFQLWEHIKLWTSVEKVSPLKTDGKDKWVVEVKQYSDHSDPVQSSSIFDAVMVCNGHSSAPHMPEIPGLETLTGPYLHSHDYRRPEPYKGLVVAILGASFSGVDIALDLAPWADRVLLSYWKTLFVSKLPDNVSEVAPVTRIERGNVVVTRDGHKYRVDAVLACTGYEYSFPFLSSDCQVTVTNQRIQGIYMHMFHAQRPSLSFIGIPLLAIPFPMFSLQSRFVIGVLEGRIHLPTEEEMESEEQRNLARLLGTEGAMEKRFHALGSKQWAYYRMLAQWSGSGGIPDWVKTLYEESLRRHFTNAMDYRRFRIRLIEPDSWEILEDVAE